MRKHPIYLALPLLVLTLFAASAANAALVNGDFSNPSLLPGNGGGDMIQLDYEHLNQGWIAKRAGSNWQIQGEVLVQTGRNGSETRVGQFFTNDLSGTGFALQLDLGGPGNITADDIELWGGVDDGNNIGTDNVTSLGGEGTPKAAIGTWTELIHVQDVPTGAISLDIAQDLGQFDVLFIRIGSPRGGGQPSNGLTIDNVAIVGAVTVPEPATATLALLGLAGLATRRRRRA